MEKYEYNEGLPVIQIMRAESHEEKDSSIKSFTAEPEMEDFSNPNHLQALIQELGLDTYPPSINPLQHNAASPSTCIHCKIISKLALLKTELSKVNQEICSTHEILNMKKDKNIELSSMIKRLENNLGQENETVVENSSTSCSCSNRCSLF